MSRCAPAVYNESVILVFHIAEWGVIALFVACGWRAWRLAQRTVDQDSNTASHSLSILLSAALFAWLFEDLNVLQAAGRGSYSYNPRFQIFLDQVPLFIALAWAVILWTAMRMTDAAPLRMPARVAADATLAVLLDLSFDVTAIRHFFWWWHGVGFDEAWFGVPAGNFFGWLYVALSFSTLTRGLDFLTGKLSPRRRQWRPLLQLCAVPPLAFALYRTLENPTNILLQRAGWTSDRAALMAFFAVFFIIAASAVWPSRLSRSPFSAPSLPSSPQPGGPPQCALAVRCRAAFHVFAIVGLLALPASGLAATQRPAMLGIAGLIWALNWFYQKSLGLNRPA